MIPRQLAGVGAFDSTFPLSSFSFRRPINLGLFVQAYFIHILGRAATPVSCLFFFLNSRRSLAPQSSKMSSRCDGESPASHGTIGPCVFCTIFLEMNSLLVVSYAWVRWKWSYFLCYTRLSDNIPFTKYLIAYDIESYNMDRKSLAKHKIQIL